MKARRILALVLSIAIIMGDSINSSAREMPAEPIEEVSVDPAWDISECYTNVATAIAAFIMIIRQ